MRHRVQINPLVCVCEHVHTCVCVCVCVCVYVCVKRSPLSHWSQRICPSPDCAVFTALCLRHDLVQTCKSSTFNHEVMSLLKLQQMSKLQDSPFVSFHFLFLSLSFAISKSYYYTVTLLHCYIRHKRNTHLLNIHDIHIQTHTTDSWCWLSMQIPCTHVRNTRKFWFACYTKSKLVYSKKHKQQTHTHTHTVTCQVISYTSITLSSIKKQKL